MVIQFLVLEVDTEENLVQITDECDRFCRYAHRISALWSQWESARSAEIIMDLPQSYSGAREAVSYRVIYGASRAINMKEIAPQEMSTTDFASDAELSELFKMIRLKFSR